MPDFVSLGVSEPVRDALGEMGIEKPTKIQEAVLPVALTKRLDIFGAAETGSGKTLAFLIPIIESLLASEKLPKEERSMSALILAPTRELVVQIHNEFRRVAKNTPFRAMMVVGGLSEEKQLRILSKAPHVIMATPGRFWALCQRDEYCSDFSKLNHVVVDEIDRIVEKGHFKEVESILEYIHSNKHPKLQTMVFSATLTFIVAPNAGKVQKTREKKVQEIAKAVRMRKNYRLVDVTTDTITPDLLKERRLTATNLLEKDTKLYFTLLSYKARSLIFTNSVEAGQRLYGLLLKLQITPKPLLLHAKMPEYKRLRNLERFASQTNSILIATDLAARGLDIKNIENVIHYQIPRTAEEYVHRSGRTARARQSGMSIMILDPEDVSRYRKICRSLNRQEEIPLLEDDNPKRIAAIEHRVMLASKLESGDYKTRKKTGHKSWVKKMVEEADLEISDVEMSDEETNISERKAREAAEKGLRAALAQPLPKSSLSHLAPPSGRGVV